MPATAEDNDPIISAQGLRKTYSGRCVVDGIDFEIQRGECCGFLGPNGAGKTTTLRMLLGTTPPSAGTLEVLGYSVPRQAREMRQHVGVVPQQDNLDPDFSVLENLRVYARYFGINGQAANRRIEELLDFAQLRERADDPVTNLSGGMCRRLILARALVNEPELLILDEPTTGLDPQARQAIWQHLRGLRRGGMTLVLTTHYMEEAARLCDRVIIMDRGKILEQGKPAALVKKYIEPHVIEVHAPDAADWPKLTGIRLAERHECIGDTLFYYTHDERPLLDALSKHPELEFLHRPASLEDVFLRLTGRELRDA